MGERGDWNVCGREEEDGDPPSPGYGDKGAGGVIPPGKYLGGKGFGDAVSAKSGVPV